LRTDGLDDNPVRRMEVHSFLFDCSDFLCDLPSFGHPLAETVLQAFRDVRIRSHNQLGIDVEALVRKVGETRALVAGGDLVLDDLTRRLRECDPVLRGNAERACRAYRHAPTRPLLRTGTVDELIDLLGRSADRDRPAVAVVLAHRALVAAEVHDDLAGLDRAVVALADAAPSLLWLVKARAALLAGRLSDGPAPTGRDPLRRALSPAIAATRGLLGEDLDRRPGDVSLAWQLVRRGLRTGSPADLRGARRLARGRSTAARVVRTYARGRLPEANHERLAGSWRRTFAGAGSPVERALAATAWVGWAVHTGVPALAAEAYRILVSVLPDDVAARAGAAARDPVLATAQEHIKDAAYWLIRAKQYREAVLTLETGRLVTGREPGGDELMYADLADLTGEGALVYLAAARAGGYALIVAADFDPLAVEMPDLDRATVVAMVRPMIAGSGTPRGTDRDLSPHRRSGDAAADVLRDLWRGGLHTVVNLHAGGDVVTFIPVGLLGLLPLHAAGATNPPPPGGERISHSHAMDFFAVRYAPSARILRRCRKIAASLGRES
jgi:hypothetical protein